MLSWIADDRKGRRLFMPLAALYCVLLIMSNILAGAKLINFYGVLTIAGGTIIFPASYVINDAMSEVYGLKVFRRVMVIGIVSLFLASSFAWLVQVMPAHSEWEHQAAYDTIFGDFMRINFASLCAIFVGSYTNAYIVEKMKSQGNSSFARGGRFLLSTAVAEGLDTILFLGISFFGKWPTDVLIAAIIGQWIFKTVWEGLALVVTLPVVDALSKFESTGVDETTT